uniref:Secreted protein n=1 Tax=Cyclopterus lumpus TaxID=8103 RepID=A0A8C2WIJ7_CYCLU
MFCPVLNLWSLFFFQGTIQRKSGLKEKVRREDRRRDKPRVLSRWFASIFRLSSRTISISDFTERQFGIYNTFL